MTWDKPKNAGQWLLLFAPPGICVLSTVLGGLVNPKEGNWMGQPAGAEPGAVLVHTLL
jgi:hypothetical protein